MKRALIIIFLFIGCKKPAVIAPDLELEAFKQLVNDVSVELSHMGFNIDPELVLIEVIAKQDMITRFNSLSGESRAEDQQVMGKSLGNSEIFRDGAVARFAFYDPNTHTVVFQKGALAGITKGLLAHELAHVYQDQNWGLKNIWESYTNDPSRELFNITNYILEGHAELVRHAYEQSQTQNQQDRTILAQVLSNLYISECVSCDLGDGVTNLPFSLGLRFLAHEYQEGGWDQVESKLINLPNSSEQILHPEKFQQDIPTKISLPMWKSAVYRPKIIYEGVLGEAFLLTKLLSLGLPAQESYLSASGWDGDYAQIYQDTSGREAVVWRILFDSLIDATRLEGSLKKLNSPGSVLRMGSAVDWIMSDTQEITKELEVFLSSNLLVSKEENKNNLSTIRQEVEQNKISEKLPMGLLVGPKN